MLDLSRSHIGSFYMSDGISRYAPLSAYHVPPLSSSLHYSNALFEGMSIVATRHGSSLRLGLFHPTLNFERMRYGISQLALNWELYSDEQIIESIFTACALNGWNRSIELEGVNTTIRSPLGDYQRIYVRPLVYCRNNAIGLAAEKKHELMLCMEPMGEYLEQADEGINVMLFPHPRSLAFPTIKAASNYQLSTHGLARLAQYNRTNDIQCGETIYTNSAGNLTEGSGENIVMIKDNELITPHPREGALPGITYRIAFMIAEEMGIKTRFGTFKYSDVESADALFFTGNAAGLVPISKVVKADENFMAQDYMQTKEGGKSQLFRKLKEEYTRVSLGDTAYGNFFTYMEDWIDETRISELNNLGADFKRLLTDENARFAGTNTTVSSYLEITPKISVARSYFDDKKWIVERLGIRHYL
ncbi:MAG: aminotransferase class IV [Candidatus Micrarchaeia archaeon]